MNTTLIICVIALALIGAFIGKYNGVMHDAEADGTPFSFAKWLKHSMLEIVFSIVLFLPFLNLTPENIEQFQALASGVTGGTISGNLATIIGAIVAGAGIPTSVTRFIMPIFSMAGAKTARRKLRATKK